MYSKRKAIFRTVFPTCCRILGNKIWGKILDTLGADVVPRTFPDELICLKETHDLPDYICDLARIELAAHLLKETPAPAWSNVKSITVNPTLTLIPVSYRNLIALITEDDAKQEIIGDDVAETHAIIWRTPETNRIQIQEADTLDLLALKIAVEAIDIKEAATKGDVEIETIEAVIRMAVSSGMLLSPKSLIRRQPPESHYDFNHIDTFLSTDTFTLQWHITQACDLHCKHCYDRSDRNPLPYENAVAILEDFKDFCRRMHVHGQVTFTGGNPLLYPRFVDIYRKTSEHGLGVAVLGNPSPQHHLEELLAIRKPAFFQISLEGLEAHNDKIRGNGHFQRSLTFLEQLRKQQIYSMVMLTLTRDNINQVLPLGKLLRDRTDHFTFNRLSTVGEGAKLLMVEPERFETFLAEYQAATNDNPILGMKDNLFNITRIKNNMEPMGGCTGYGCGAAFNFVSLLSDGEVHACRKFPSPIGNMLQSSLFEIYHSDLAQKYRKGSEACNDCRLNIVCRGCLAIVYSCGRDIFQDKDPFCFISEELKTNT